MNLLSNILFFMLMVGLSYADQVNKFLISKSPENYASINGGEYNLGNPFHPRKDKTYRVSDKAYKVKIEPYHIFKNMITAGDFCVFLNSEYCNSLNKIELCNYKGFSTGVNLSNIILKDGVFIPLDGNIDFPANSVSWLGAVKFCDWLNSVRNDSFTYRLPSEAEWEAAARGKASRLWPWGNDAPTAKHGAAFSVSNYSKFTRINVGSYPDGNTPEGISDLSASGVMEWCAGIYKNDAKASDMVNYSLDTKDLVSFRPVRGGAHAKKVTKGLKGQIGFLTRQNPKTYIARTWTRSGADPVQATHHGAFYTFRIVAEKKE